MRTKVLIKHKHDVHWEDPEVGAYPDEAKLKTILRDDPALFPFDEPRRPVVMVDEFPVSIGNTYGFVDLVGVSAAGSITIVECKLEKNPDIKRRLVGQLIEYAAALWGVSYEGFDALWQAVERPAMMTDEQWEERKRPPLEEDIANALGGDPSFDRGVFRAAVAENLQAGRFTLVVAVDSITDALERSILYLSEHSGSDARVVALELGYVAHGDVEVLVPRAFGLEAAERRPTPTTPRARGWDTASFDAALRELKGEAALELATGLREWALSPDVGLEVSYGRGATYGTEGFVIADPSGYRRSIFSLATSSMVTVDLGNLKIFPAYAEEMPRLDILHALARIEGRTRKDEQADGWPQFSTDVLMDPAKLADFKGLVGDILSRIRER
jgi:hypothetical protein